MAVSYVGSLLAAPGYADLGFPSGSHTYQTLTVQSSPPAMQANDTIVLAVLTEASNVTATTPATDTRGNTYTRIGDQASGSLGSGLDIVCANVTTPLQAGDTITVNLASSVPAIIVASVFRGLSTSLTLDGSYEGTNDGFASAWTTPAVTTTAEPELGLALAGTGGTIASFTDTPNAGWTDLCAVSGSNCPRSFVCQYNITSATGSLAPGGTFKSSGAATNESYNAAFVVLKAAGGAPTPNPQIAAGFFAA